MPLFSPMRASRASSFALSPTGSSIPPRTFGDCIAPSIDMKKNRSFFRSTPDSQGFFSRASRYSFSSAVMPSALSSSALSRMKSGCCPMSPASLFCRSEAGLTDIVIKESAGRRLR